MPLPLAFIPAAAELAGQGVNAIAGGKMNKKNRQFTAEQNALNRQQTWEMWDRTNQFNLATSDPTFIMQRLKNAGINPWTFTGTPDTVKADTMNTQQFAPPEQKAPQFNLNEAYQAFMQNKMQSKQLELMDKQIASQDADINLKNTQAGSLSASTDATIQDMNQKAQLFGGQVEGQTLDNKNKGADYIYKTNSSNEILKRIEQIGSVMRKSDQEIKVMKQNIAESLVRIDNLKRQGKLIEAQAEGQKLINGITEATSESKIDAERAKNEVIRDTDGLSEKGIQQLPGVVVGWLGRQARKITSGSDVQKPTNNSKDSDFTRIRKKKQ